MKTRHQVSGIRFQVEDLKTFFRAVSRILASGTLRLVPAFIGIYLLTSLTSVFGQALTSGADFLKIDPGARSQGMGGAFTAVADDATALSWNPAGLALLKNPEVSYLHMLYLADIGYNFGGVALPIPMGDNTLGLGAGIVNLGTSFDSTGGLVPAVTTGDNAFFLSVAYRVKDVLSFGLTGKYVLRSIDSFTGGAFAGDFGILFTPTGSRLRVGAGIFNVGQPMQFVSTTDSLPMLGRIGLAGTLLEDPHNSLLLAGDFFYQFEAGVWEGSAGAEYWLDKTLALRVGYTGNTDQSHFTAGAGINIPKLGELDYAFAPVGSLGNTHRLSLLFRFGAEGGAAGLLSPREFLATPMDSAISLSWKAGVSPDVIGYNLYQKKPGADNFTRLTSRPLSETTVRLKNLKNGTNYTFAVSSVSAAGRESSFSQISAVPMPASINTQAAAPAVQAPTGLKAVPSGEGVELTWSPSSAEVSGFKLYMADAEGKPGKNLGGLLTENKVILKKVSPDRVYRFVLTSVGKSGIESPASNVLEVKLSNMQKPAAAVFAPPSQLLAQAGDGLAYLSWTSAQGAAGYHLYKSDDGKLFKRLTKGPLAALKVTLKPLVNGKTYYFAVTSVASNGTESDKTVQTAVPFK